MIKKLRIQLVSIIMALLTLLFDLILRKMKWVKPGYMTL